MPDKRRNSELKVVRQTIIEILTKSPLQAKDIRRQLEEEGLSYSRDRLNDLLNLMMDTGDIERKIHPDNPYPVYSITKKSKLFAEFNGVQFSKMFCDGMFRPKLFEKLLDEFQKSKHKKTRLDALMQLFGFIVLGSLMGSRMYDKDVRSDWLRPVLDLEYGWSISKLFDEIHHEDKLVYMAKELTRNYPENTDVLNLALRHTKKIKDLTESEKENSGDFEGFGVKKLIADYVSNYKKEK
jgi:hypothetical protein